MDRFEQIRNIVTRALELDPEERRVLLDVECRYDPELRREIETVLANDDEDASTLLSTGGSGAFLGRLVGGELRDTPVRALELPSHWGNLEIIELLGEGSTGAVYRARDPALDLEVALKVVHPRFGPGNDRILDEGRRLARLRHPNVVRIYGVDKRDDAVGLRMELVLGHSLHDAVKRDGTFGAHEMARIGIELCRALTAVHANGLVHRDVKAQNVMLELSSRVVLMDLGAGIETDRATNADPRLVVGTPLYLAPELLRNAPATPGSDLYALGVLLYFLAADAYPIVAPDLDRLRAAHEHGSITPLEDVCPDLPAAFGRVVERAMAADPAARFGSAEELARALAAAREETVTADMAGKPRPASGQTRHNLPPRLTPFVGRRRALEDVARLCEERRLVTLTGAGGSGKTRLALEVGTSLLDTFPDGVWFVELAPLDDPERVPDVVARTLGLREGRNETRARALIRHLGEKPECLVILDNCEHVLPGAVSLTRTVLREAPGVCLLLTSREALGTEGEAIYDVRPLRVPDPFDTRQGAAGAQLPELLQIASVRLFVESARAARHDFTLTETNAPAVVEICRRLDGLPLALELAGASVRALPVVEIAKRLDHSFRLLARSREPAVPHHQALETSIAWGYDLLEAAEQRVFQCLSVFAGGWTLEAAEAVLPVAAGLRESEVVVALSKLVSKSLVQLGTESASGDARYRMLETIRQYAAARLEADGGNASATRASHIRYCIQFVAGMGGEVRGKDQRNAMARLDAEHENFLAALTGAIEHGNIDDALTLAAELGHFWVHRSFWSEGRRFYGTLLDRPELETRTAARADMTLWSGILHVRLGDFEEARALLNESISLRSELGDRAGEASAVNGLGILHYSQGDNEGACAYYERSLELRRAIDDRLGIAQVLNNLGIIFGEQGDHDTARRHYEEAIEIHRDLDNERGVATVLNSLGVLSARRKDYDRARDAFQQALDVHRALGDRRGAAIKLTNLAALAMWQAQLDDSRDLYEEALAIQQEIGDNIGIVSTFEGLAVLAVETRAFAHGARLLGAADALRLSLGVGPRPADEEDELEQAKLALRENLGEEAFGAERELGAVMRLADVARPD